VDRRLRFTLKNRQIPAIRFSAGGYLEIARAGGSSTAGEFPLGWRFVSSGYAFR
jgi:hypothetical protein